MPCCICKNNIDENNFVYQNFIYCTNCFHIQKNNINSNSIKSKNKQENKQILHNQILSKISSYLNFQIIQKYDEYLNILIVNDINSELSNKIYNNLNKKISKYKIKIVSISPYYNSSFFSTQHHYKLNLTDYTTNIIKDNHNLFDIIILNTTLTNSIEPLNILNNCKKLCKNGTLIISEHIHTNILSSLELLNLNKNIHNIFNTNSIQTLCKIVKLQLHHIEYINHFQFLSYIIHNTLNNEHIKNEHIKNEHITEHITELLYNEIINNIYDENTYIYLKNYWINYINIVNDFLDKYKSINYHIVCINRENNIYYHLNYDTFITTDNLIFLNDKNPSNTLLIITNDLNRQEIIELIKTTNTKTWLLFDLYKLISYTI